MMAQLYTAPLALLFQVAACLSYASYVGFLPITPLPLSPTQPQYRIPPTPPLVLYLPEKPPA